MSEQPQAQPSDTNPKIDKLRKPSYPKRVGTIKERSDVDPHEKYSPDKEGLEDWGDGFFVNPEPVIIKRDPTGAIRRTVPISEAQRGDLDPDVYKDGELITADPVPRPGPKRPQKKVVEMLAGLLMRYYSSLEPGQIGFNPLYDGIPAEEAIGHKHILEPDKLNANLVHVPAHEVHEWLKKLIGQRAEIRNKRTNKLGWDGDIQDLVVRLKKG